MIEIFYVRKGLPILALCVLLMTGCSFLSVVFTSIPMFLSDVGKIKFGRPVSKGELTRIPFRLQGDKWNEDSARVLIEVNATRHGYEIYFTLITCLASKEVKKAEPEIILRRLKPGRYKLIYQNPDKVSIMLSEIGI
jgi:hypothetical protein